MSLMRGVPPFAAPYLSSGNVALAEALKALPSTACGPDSRGARRGDELSAADHECPVRLSLGDVQEVGGVDRAERHAGGDQDDIAGLGKALLPSE